MTKLEFDLYYVMTNSYTKFQVNISKDDREKSGKLNLAKGNNSCKSISSVTKLEFDLCYVMTNSYTKFQVNISKDDREKSGKLNFSKGQKTPVKADQAWPNCKLSCIISWQIHIPNFKSISQTTTDKSPENKILAKGNNSCKNKSRVTKLELDLYYVMTNSYKKF